MTDFQKEVYMETIKTAIGDEPITRFAERAGLSAGNLSRIRNGQVASVDTLTRIAAASGRVSLQQLLDAATLMGDSEVPQLKKTVSIPVAEYLPETKSKLLRDGSLPREEYYEETFAPGEYVFFIANDDALMPRIHCGDRVLVDLSKKPENGDIVLVRFKKEGRGTLRRVSTDGYKYFFYGNDLSLYPMEQVKKSEADIFGVAVEARIRL